MSTHTDTLDPEGDALLAAWEIAEDKVRQHTFPRLVVERVTDDGETFDALRCPRCGSLVDAQDDLYAIDVSIRANSTSDIGDDTFEHHRVSFDAGDYSDYGETMNYLHGDHPVSLPEGFTEDWS